MLIIKLSKIRRYVLAGGLVVVMLFNLTACGSNDYDSNRKDIPTESVPPENDSVKSDDGIEQDSTSDDTKTHEKSYEVDDSGKFDASFGISDDGVEQIEEGSD